MAAITITVPAGVTNRVLDAISTKYGYTGFLADGITVQTKADFVKAWIKNMVMTAVREHEANTAGATASATAAASVNTDIVIT